MKWVGNGLNLHLTFKDDDEKKIALEQLNHIHDMCENNDFDDFAKYFINITFKDFLEHCNDMHTHDCAYDIVKCFGEWIEEQIPALTKDDNGWSLK